MESRPLLFATATLLTSVSAVGQETEPNTPLTDVVVTGTRVQDRSRLDTLAPVDVLSSTALSEQGTTELAEALSNVAPSLNFPRPAVTDGTDHIRPATLRGLAPDQALVLVNSKRRHQSSLVNVNNSIGRGSTAVDLNAIPLAAIERIEVLRDGASAQYGSDAIAGVINIQLREARDGGNAALTVGQYNTDVEPARTSYSKNDGTTITGSAWAGFPLAAEGFLTLSGEYRDRDPTSRGDVDPRITPNAVDSRYGDPEVTDYTAYLNGGIPLSGDWNAYGWAGYQIRDGSAAATPRIPGNPNNDLSVYPNGWLPIITSDIKDTTAAFGFNGPLAGWDADVSVVYGANEFDFGVEETLNGTLVPNSPTSFDAGGVEYDQLVLNFGVVRGFELGGEGPTNVAAGLEARRESYAIHAGEPDSYRQGPRTGTGITPGAQGFPGFQPSNEIDESREAVGIYVDAETQITERLLGSVAVRGEHYSDFGENITGKISGRFDFTEAFALRGTVATGFRAPSLQQQFFTSTATNFVNGIPFEIGTFPATSPVAAILGAQKLDAEESLNYSLGAVFRTGAFEATLDAYRIKIDDRIVLSENLGIAANQGNVRALLAPFNVGGARFFINGVDTTTEGLDLVLRYSIPLAGKLDLTASGNINSTEVTKLPTTNVLSSLDPAPPLFDRINRLLFEEGTPKNKVALTADWSTPVAFGRLGTVLRATRYGAVVEPGGAVNGTQDIQMDPEILLDLELRAKVGDHFSGTLGVDNLLDQYPEQVPPALNTTGLLGFSRYSPYGFNGRFLYGRLAWNW